MKTKSHPARKLLVLGIASFGACALIVAGFAVAAHYLLNEPFLASWPLAAVVLATILWCWFVAEWLYPMLAAWLFRRLRSFYEG